MRRPFHALPALALFAVSMAAGCAGGGTSATVPAPGAATAQTAKQAAFIDAGRAAASPTATPTTLIAVSDDENEGVSIYNASGQRIKSLVAFFFPQGLASDSTGNLYVADQTDSRIQVFTPAFTYKKTLEDPGQEPLSLDTTDNGTYVGVANQYTTNNGPGSITMYKDGTATATITNSAILQAFFDAFDASGNLYFTFSPSSGGCPCIGEIAGATKGGTTVTLLSTVNTISPYGIQVTNDGDIAVFDMKRDIIFTYGPPVNGLLGTPIADTVVRGTETNPLNAPAQFAFTSDMHHLYIANNSDNSVVYEFGYPRGVRTTDFSIGGTPFGVAVFPKQYPH
jgi:hypothetical protein